MTQNQPPWYILAARCLLFTVFLMHPAILWVSYYEPQLLLTTSCCLQIQQKEFSTIYGFIQTPPWITLYLAYIIDCVDPATSLGNKPQYCFKEKCATRSNMEDMPIYRQAYQVVGRTPCSTCPELRWMWILHDFVPSAALRVLLWPGSAEKSDLRSR